MAWRLPKIVTTLCVVSDLHVNSTVGLAAPGTGFVRSKSQVKLWKRWLDYWGRAKEQPGKKILVMLGDLGELDCKRRSVQLFTGDKARILDQVERALVPALDVVESSIIIRGTPAHEGRGCWLEEHVAADIGALHHEGEPYSHYDLTLSIDKVLLDMAHDGQVGRLMWTRNTPANRIAFEAFVYYGLILHKPVPHLVLRGHQHKRAHGDCVMGGHRVDVYGLPAWQLRTEYMHKLDPMSMADIGGLFIRCNEGSYELDEINYLIEDDKQWLTM